MNTWDMMGPEWSARQPRRSSRSVKMILTGLAMTAVMAVSPTPAAGAPAAGAPAAGGPAAGGLFGFSSASKSKLEDVADRVGDLIQIKLSAGRLQLDRDHWATVDKTIDKKAFEKRYRKETIGRYGNHEYFKKMYEKRLKKILEGPPYRRLFTRLKLDVNVRDDSGESLKLEFDADDGLSGRFGHGGQTYDISLAENVGRRRRLVVRESGGAMVLMLLDPSDGSLSVIVQRSDGKVLVGQSIAGRVAAVSGENFGALRRSHGRHVQATIDKFKRLGVRFSHLGAGPTTRVSTVTEKAMALLPPKPAARPVWKRDLYQDLGDAVGKLVALRLSSKGLRFDMAHWQQWQDADSGVQSMRKEAVEAVKAEMFRRMSVKPPGRDPNHRAIAAMRFLKDTVNGKVDSNSSGSGQGSGSTYFKTYFYFRNEFRAQLRIGRRKLAIEMIVKPPLGRRLAVVSGADGSIRVQVDNNDGGVLLVLQGAKRQFTVLESAPDGVYLLAAPSFGEFARKYPAYTRGRLFGYLKYMGVTVPLDHESDVVKEAVLFRLAGPGADDAAEGRRLIALLDSDSYKARTKATATLTARFTRYKKLLEETRAKTKVPIETKQRLDMIFANKIAPYLTNGVIDAMGLLDDVAYLKRLLNETTDKAAIEAIKTRIKQIEKGPAKPAPPLVVARLRTVRLAEHDECHGESLLATSSG